MQGELKPPCDLVGWEGARPACVRADEHEASHCRGPLPVQLQGERGTPGVTEYVRALQAQRVDEMSETVSELR
jgi:hypothetical protein